jgi:hypothetical protein
MQILFHEWRAEGPSIVVIALCSMVAIGLLLILFLRSLYLQASLVGVVVIYMTYCFIDASIKRPCVTVYTHAIRVREGASQFDIKAMNIERINARVYPKGGRSVFAHVKNIKKGIEIPMVTDDRHIEYYKALSKFCEMNHILLWWPNEVSKPYR